MYGTSEEFHASSESSASNVQRGRRRSRSGLESSVPGQYRAQFRRLERAPQRAMWTLHSAVEDVLLEGVDVTERMTLNDFIRRYVDPDFVLEGRNVMMGVFARRPEDCISDERLLRR
ncbi:retrotransposon hot spot (RHS) protein, partial [Trypanosoma conorhini]